MKRRVVITGIGLVTPLGKDLTSTWEALMRGRSGIVPITRFDPSRLGCRIAGEVRDFDPSTVLDAKEARRYDRFMQFAMVATSEAIHRSGLLLDDGLREQTGVIYGSGMGGLSTLLGAEASLNESGPGRVTPFLATGSAINMAAGVISMRWGLYGPNYATVSACSTSAHAIADGYYAIQRGDADVMVTGGSEAVLSEVTMASFDNMGALSRRNHEPAKASRPFDRDRDGFVLAEGAATLILEELSHARARGATPLAEIIGVGMAADAYHVAAPAPDGAGAARGMRRALAASGLAAQDVSYINAHATSTRVGDASESLAIRKVFEAHANRLAVSSTKSMTGHLLGAAGAVETAFTAMALFHQVLPPTINLDHPDEDCSLDYVAHEARPQAFDVAITNSNGFGGANVTLALRRYA